MTASKPARIMRLIEVKRTEALSAHMRRIVFTGTELIGFPEGHNGANIKLVLPKPTQSRSEFRKAIARGERPLKRTYTVRDYQADRNELVIDFVVHGDAGPASKFAAHCGAGDEIALSGPGPLKITHLTAPSYLFCADMSALPAAAAVLETLSKDAKGAAFFEITSLEDMYPVSAPSGIDVHWLIHSTPHMVSNRLLEAVQPLSWVDDNTIVFAAGEHNATMAIKDNILNVRKLPRTNTYIAGYWKIGLVEDDHQLEKRATTN